MHMVIESICQTAVLIANGYKIKDFVLIGNLINFPECWSVCDMIRLMYPYVNFIIPRTANTARRSARPWRIKNASGRWKAEVEG